MKLKSIQSGAAFTFLLLLIVAVPRFNFAQEKEPIEQITGTAINVGGAGDPVRIDLMTWSSGAERAQLLAALSKGDKEFASTLQSMPTHGYLWTAETAGYMVKYADKAMLPNGTTRIVIATERRLGSWDPKLWKPLTNGAVTEYPFTVLEMRFDAKNVGEGKASLSARIVADPQTKTITLENYPGLPVVVKEIKRLMWPTS